MSSSNVEDFMKLGKKGELLYERPCKYREGTIYVYDIGLPNDVGAVYPDTRCVAPIHWFPQVEVRNRELNPPPRLVSTRPRIGASPENVPARPAVALTRPVIAQSTQPESSTLKRPRIAGNSPVEPPAPAKSSRPVIVSPVFARKQK